MKLGARSRGSALLRSSVDVGAVFVAFLLMFWAYSALISRGWVDSTVPNAAIYIWLPALFALICVSVFAQMDLYSPYSGLLNLWELQTTAKGFLITAGFFYAALFILKVPDSSRFVVLGATASCGILLLVGRRATASFLSRKAFRTRDGAPVIIVGAGSAGQLLFKKIVNAPHLQRRVVGFLDNTNAKGARVFARVAGGAGVYCCVLGRPRELARVIAQHGIAEMFVDAASLEPDELDWVLQTARELDVSTGIVPGIGRHRADQYRILDLSALPVLQAHVVAGGAIYLLTKRALDIWGSLALLTLMAPVWLTCAIAIKATSPGPVLFRQRRIGKDGKPIVVLKFRTMIQSAEPYARSPRTREDPRVTRVGRVLRLLGLDELPQLINVLKGDMSLVGPRPEMPFIAEGYSELERRRLAVLPGITGPWQLSPDREGQIHECIEYDLFYISRRSTLLDLVILIETGFYTLGKLLPGAEGPELLPLPTRLRRRRRRSMNLARPEGPIDRSDAVAVQYGIQGGTRDEPLWQPRD